MLDGWNWLDWAWVRRRGSRQAALAPADTMIRLSDWYTILGSFAVWLTWLKALATIKGYSIKFAVYVSTLLMILADIRSWRSCCSS